GMSDYLAKPVGLADLARTLARWAGPVEPAATPPSTHGLTPGVGGAPGEPSPLANLAITPGAVANPPEAIDTRPALARLSAESAVSSAPATENGNGEPVLDPAALASLRRLQRPGRPDLVSAVLERFEADLPAQVGSLHAAVDARDAEALWHTAHALKGDSGRVGARELQHQCA